MTRSLCQSLPTKVVQSIIDQVAVAQNLDPWTERNKDLESCCMAANMFVEPCQRYLFHSVILRPPTIENSSVRTTDRTRLFSKLVTRKPHLANYVEILAYWVTMNDMFDVELIKTLGLLINIRHFHLQFPSPHWRTESEFIPPNNRYTSGNEMWFDRILAIAKNPLLETLSLFNTEYFVEATGIPASIHTLSLDVAWVPTFTPDVTNNLDIARPFNGYHLNSLIIGAMFSENLRYLRRFSRQVDKLTIFHRITSLDLRLCGDEDYHNTSFLLQSTETLESLMIKTWCSPVHDGTHIPFYDLNQKSFATLSNVVLVAHFAFDDEGGSFIPDPYLGLDYLLIHPLPSLRQLSVEIHICAWEGLDALKFGAAWSCLDNRIPQAVGSGEFPNFNKLSVSVLLDDVNFDDDNDVVRTVEETEKKLYPIYFKDILRLASINHSFEFFWNVYV